MKPVRRRHKALFVCSANIDRSPTAEKLFQNWKGRWKAMSAGIAPSPGRNHLTQKLIDWADLVMVMEPLHSEYVHTHFKCDPNKVRVLDIVNRYIRDEPELIQLLQMKVAPILDLEDRLNDLSRKTRE